MYMAVYLSPLSNTKRDQQMPKPTLKDHGGPISPAHFVPLADIMQSYEGAVYNYMRENDAPNVVVTLPISVEIADKGTQKFFVAVAVTMQFDSPEPLSDEARRQTPKGHQTVFAWIPANTYDTADFGIYIDDIEIGENLKNGLVGEVIDKASIEDAVISLSKDEDSDKVNASNLC